MATEPQPVKIRAYVPVDPHSADWATCEFCGHVVAGDAECPARDAGRRCKP